MSEDSSICIPVNNGLFNYRVAGIAVRDGRVLLHKATSDRFWSLPGGRVQLFEFSGEALHREMIEELGCEIKLGKLVAIAENFFEYNADTYHELGFYYLMEVLDINDLSDRIVVEEKEELLFRWHALESLSEETLYPKIPIRELVLDQEGVRHFRFKLEVLQAMDPGNTYHM